MKLQRLSLLFLLAAGLGACHTSYHKKQVTPSQTRINGDSLHLFDSTAWKMILPYKQKLDAQMNESIIVNEITLKKEQPEGTLCNLVADACLWYAQKNYEEKSLCCGMNYGGVRIPSIPAGTITLGKLYELMPFDNNIELLEVKGSTLEAFCDWMAGNGGWPVSGIRYTIKAGKAYNISVAGAPLDPSRNYLLTTSDYLANGGDKCEMLKQYSRKIALNYKVRDAIIDYLKDMQANNRKLLMQKEGRVISE